MVHKNTGTAPHIAETASNITAAARVPENNCTSTDAPADKRNADTGAANSPDSPKLNRQRSNIELLSIILLIPFHLPVALYAIIITYMLFCFKSR